jgi:hypothetical protein
MSNRKQQIATLPAVPREGLLMLLGAIEKVMGRSTEVGRCLTRAIASHELRDLLRVQAGFDALSAEDREGVSTELRLMLEAEASREEEPAAGGNVVSLRPRAVA